ncbi:uncharacterized protein LOC127282157 [Leptopilina boulardi]|uniref:uncharacterized protein LOC127282157 n=1 Tax=Leptopilina boulardi TaxID=63433 RepID=UPI0021F528F3|nr:uncharacterized protein LOC127282157 [Leptopilina boulardi]
MSNYYFLKIVGLNKDLRNTLQECHRGGKNDKRYWDCEKVRRKECKERAITQHTETGIIVLKGPTGEKKSEHSHAPNQENLKAEIVKVNLKRRAEEQPECPPAQILRDNLGNLSAAILAKLPERENLKKSMRRERRRQLPPNPKTLEDVIELPEFYRKTLSNERFLIYDSREDETFGDGRVLVKKWIALQQRFTSIAEKYETHKENNERLKYLENFAHNIQLS